MTRNSGTNERTNENTSKPANGLKIEIGRNTKNKAGYKAPA